MRLTLLPFLACHLYNSFAAPFAWKSELLISRDTTIIERGLQSATQATRQLTRAVQSLNPAVDDNRAQAQEIDRRGREVVEVKRRAVEEMRRGPMVSLIEMSRISDPISLLQSTTQSCMNALISAAPTIRSLGGRDSILQILRGLDSISYDFTEAIVSRMPTESAKSEGRNGGLRTKAMFARAIDVYTA